MLIANIEKQDPTFKATENSLFKYLPTERYTIFQDGLFRYTSPIVFNDPFEIIPLVIYNLFFEGPDIGIMDYNPLSFIGALSLSDTFDNLLMWSHYANTHEGFVIEFDKSHPYFSNESFESKNLSVLGKVRYSTDFKILTDMDLNNLSKIYEANRKNKEFDFKSFPFNIFFNKGIVWSYENEIRHLKYYKNSDKYFVAKDKEEKDFIFHLNLFKIPFAAMKSVILGANSPTGFFEFVEKQTKENIELQHLKIYKASLSPNLYKLII